MVLVVIALATWGSLWQVSTVQVLSDNMAVVRVLLLGPPPYVLICCAYLDFSCHTTTYKSLYNTLLVPTTRQLMSLDNFSSCLPPGIPHFSTSSSTSARHATARTARLDITQPEDSASSLRSISASYLHAPLVNSSLVISWSDISLIPRSSLWGKEKMAWYNMFLNYPE